MEESLNLPKKRKVVGDASIWKRALAFLIDLLIIDFTISSSFSGILQEIIPSPDDPFANYSFLMSNPEVAGRILSVFFAIAGLAFLYFVLFEYLLEQTPGKMLSRLYVKSEGKEKLKLLQVVVRNLYFIPIFPLYFLWFIDPVYLLIRKRRLSEIISKTKLTEVYMI